jgi:hypothetical protein
MQRIRVGDSVFRIVLARGPGELHNVNNGLTSGCCQGGLDGRFQYGGAVRRLCQEVWPVLFPFGEIGAAITTGAAAGGHQAISAGPESASRALVDLRCILLVHRFAVTGGLANPSMLYGREIHR